MGHAMPEYLIKRALVRPELQGLWDGPAWMVEHALLLRRYRHLFPDEAGRGGSRVRPARAGRVARGSQAVVDGYLAIPCEPRLGMPVASVAS